MHAFRRPGAAKRSVLCLGIPQARKRTRRPSAAPSESGRPGGVAAVRRNRHGRKQTRITGRTHGARAQQRLASDPQWLALGYWQPNLIGGGSTSLIDNPDFFLAANGKSDPAKELESSLAAFFEPTPENPDQHPQCLKPARYRWLKARLGFDPARLIEQPCPRLWSWEAELNPGRVTLIFPAAYINNPSSMFGHTLIRFDPPAGLAPRR